MLNKKKINFPYWVRVLITVVFTASVCCLWGFMSSDYVYNELSKQTRQVGDVEINLGECWFYAHTTIMWCLLIAMLVIIFVWLTGWCIKGKKAGVKKDEN